MYALAVVEHVDRLCNGISRFRLILKLAVVHQLIRERTEEALDRRIVVAVPRATRDRDHPPRRAKSI